MGNIQVFSFLQCEVPQGPGGPCKPGKHDIVWTSQENSVGRWNFGTIFSGKYFRIRFSVLISFELHHTLKYNLTLCLVS